MFEKEAEEWVKENMDCCKTDNSINQSIPYFSEEERCCARSAFIDGAEFGYNKANEWHYVKDKLPDHSGQFYVALKGHTETFILNYDYDEDDESKMVWLDDDDTNFDDEVYAWHEKLKAPKETEK